MFKGSGKISVPFSPKAHIVCGLKCAAHLRIYCISNSDGRVFILPWPRILRILFYCGLLVNSYFNSKKLVTLVLQNPWTWGFLVILAQLSPSLAHSLCVVFKNLDSSLLAFFVFSIGFSYIF